MGRVEEFERPGDYRAFRDVTFHGEEVVLTCIGEGSTSQGEFWEALNTASPTAVIVDARPPEQYRGEESASDTPRAGRIPGAVSLYWVTTIESKESPQVLRAAELRRLFQSAGIAPGRKVVSYCHSGVQGAYAYFIARYLGYDAALYDGSFQEWSNAEGTHVAAGR